MNGWQDDISIAAMRLGPDPDPSRPRHQDRPFAGTRVWHLVLAHYRIRRRLSGEAQLFPAIAEHRQRGYSLRLTFALLAREIRRSRFG